MNLRRGIPSMAPAGTAGRTLASLALALLFVSPANAADRVGYSTRWSIAEPLSAPQPASDGLLRVAQGEIFMAARLLPPGAARLSADLLDKDGKVLVPQGSELFALAAEGSRIFCTVNSRGTGAVMSVLVGGRTFSHTCLIDADDDGGFDGHFTVRGQIKGLPNFSGRVPKSLKPAGAIRYEQLAPQEMQTSYFVGVEYRGDNNLMGNQIFDLVFGTEGNTDALSDRMMIKARDIPRSLEVLGGSFTLIASADDVATIRIDRLFPPQPFGVQKTTSYQYY